MLFQPTNITPSSFAGVGGDLIDAADGMTITWQVNGTSAMTGYEIVIYQNDAASTQLYTTGVVTISPFYGVDGMGNAQFYSVTISASDLSTAGIVNGSGDGYKYKITQYWSSTDYIEQSAENFFVAQAAPTCSINTMYLYTPSDPITATWSQTDGVGLDWVRWVVTELNDSTVLIDTGNIHTQVMQLDYNGWVNGASYSVTLSYQLQNGYSGTTNEIIYAQWTNVTQRGSASAYLGTNCSEIVVRYPVPSYGELQNPGAASASITDGKLVNPSGSTLTWNIETLVTNRAGSGGLAWSGTPSEAATLSIYSAFTAPTLWETLDVTFNPSGTVEWNVGTESGAYATGEIFTGKTVTFLAGNNTWYIAVKRDADERITYISDWEQGNIRESNGTNNDTAVTRCRTNGAYNFDGASSVTITVPSGYKLGGREYSGTPWSQDNYVGVAFAFMEGSVTLTPVEGHYYRFTIAYVGDGTITPSDIPTNSCVIVEVIGGTGGVNKYSFDAPITLSLLNGLDSSTISLSGAQTCNFFGLTNGDASQTLVNTLLSGNGAQPEFTSAWLFLSDFSSTTGYQSIGSLDDVSWAGVTPDVSEVIVYRQETGVSVMQKLATVTNPNDIGMLADYGVISGKSYTYSVQYLFDDSSSLSANTVILTTNTVTPCYWDWLLAEAEEAPDGTFHIVAEYRFGLNLATESMSNNNVPVLMQNFTRYPTRQAMSANYRSGSLTAYIGRVDQTANVYIDTAAQADAIMALGASTNAKFLRSRKGELWKVDTAAATTLMLGDNYKEQPYTVALTWAEVGDASTASIISLPSDDGWTDPAAQPNEEAGNSTLYINGRMVQTGSTITIGG